MTNQPACVEFMPMPIAANDNTPTNEWYRFHFGPGRAAEVLKDISFELEPGSFHFLTGASGAGKTSLLRLIHLGLRPSRGLISLFNRDVTLLKRRERGTGQAIVVDGRAGRPLRQQRGRTDAPSCLCPGCFQVQ